MYLPPHTLLETPLGVVFLRFDVYVFSSTYDDGNGLCHGLIVAPRRTSQRAGITSSGLSARRPRILGPPALGLESPSGVARGSKSKLENRAHLRIPWLFEETFLLMVRNSAEWGRRGGAERGSGDKRAS